MTLYRSSIHTVFASETLLAEGGLETTLVFGPKPRELPQFAAFPILDNDDDRAMLLDYYREFFAVAKKHGVSIQMDTVTWRASSKWGALLGYSESALEKINRDAVDLIVEIRQECQTNRNKIIISGAIGPRGDGYIPGDLMTPEEAKRYHTAQIATFASTPVDIVTAYTLSYVEEGIGIALAAAEIGVPVFINFTVETNGLLPSGMPLPDAISVIDAVCDAFGAGSRPVGYGINCAHPTHFAHVLEAGAAVDAPWLRRFTALRANASAKSHAELDEATELDAGDPADLGQRYRALLQLMSHNISVLGGCCGTDVTHARCKLRVDHDSAWRYPRVAAYKTVATLHVIASEVDTAAAPASMLPQRADVEELVAEADTLDHLQWVLDSVKVRRYFAMGYYDGMLSPGSSSEGATLHITGSSTPRFTFPKGLDKVVLRRVSGSYTLPPVASISMLECWCANNPLQLPPQIECLALRAPWFSLPITIPETSTLRSLTLRSWTSKLPEEKPPAVLPRLPSILHELIIDNYDTMYGRVVIHLDTPLGHLPLGLRKLVLKAHMFNQPLGPLPPALEDLDLSGSPGFDQQLGALPDKLQILRLHPHYTQKLGELPASLKTLQIGAQYPHPLHMYVGTDIVRIAKPR